jgi:hypothetical protein
MKHTASQACERQRQKRGKIVIYLILRSSFSLSLVLYNPVWITIDLVHPDRYLWKRLAV